MGTEYIIYLACLAAVLLVCASAADCASNTDNKPDVAIWGLAYTVNPDGNKPAYAPQLNDMDPHTSTPIEQGGAVQLDWDQPRDVRTLVIKGSLPPADRIRLQYWRHIWPDNGHGGWQRLEDPFNGKWIDAKTTVTSDQNSATITFQPLDSEEIPGVRKTGFDYRHTYKIRLIFDAPAKVNKIEAYTDAEWREAEIKLEWKPKSGNAAKWDGRIEARNAEIKSITSDKTTTIKVKYAYSANRLSADRGMLIFRSPGWESFSVFIDDAVSQGGVYVRDIDAFVSDASKDLSYSTWQRPKDAWDGTVMAKVTQMPEQSLERVMKAMPLKPEPEVHLGVPNLRQEFTLDMSGNIILMKESLRSPAKDTDRRPWDRYAIHYVMSTQEQPIFNHHAGRETHRYLEDGYMPIIHTDWSTGDIQYKQAAYAVPLLDKIGNNKDQRRGDEPVVLQDKVEITNTGSAQQTAYIWIEIGYKLPMSITRDGLLLLDKPSDGVQRPGLTPVRGYINTNGKGNLSYIQDCLPAKPDSLDPDIRESDKPRPAVKYTLTLKPGESHVLYFNVPYIELLNNEECKALKSQNYDGRHTELVDYWHNRINEGMQYEVPEPILNDLYRANLWHVLISTDRDPVTGLYQHGAATMNYWNYANETGMVAQSLEMRGEYKEALRLLEPFLKNQGVKPLPGNFQSKDGLFYAAHPDPEHDTYTAQGYNMHHGWALWKLAEHYKYTKDRKYLESIVPNLIAGCDWITRERQATKALKPDGTKPVEWGLAPAGDLEDVEEFLYWYATNAYYYVGMHTTAEVLTEINHPEAERIRREAEEYKADILASLTEAIATAPVVQLKDGTSVPYIPPRANVSIDRKEGWIREGLYPALHILDGELVAPSHPIITWMLNELEDNIFLSPESGYEVEDQLKSFFDLGGFNPQPNLLSNSVAHLRRDEVPNFIRVFYNMLWASLYPDVMCFAEWVPYYGKGGGPLYKTPDECKFVQYMRYMLILEEGNELRLGMGVPRAWMEDGKSIRIEKAATFFGEMDMNITSHVNEGHIHANLVLPSRNPAETTVIRLRHPQGKPIKKVTVNGSGWRDFDPDKDLIRLREGLKTAEVVAYY